MVRRVPYPKISADEPITIDVLERCLDRLAFEMARSPHGGEIYLPIFERFEADLAAAKAKEAMLARARVLAEKTAERTATTEDDANPATKHAVPLKDRMSLSPADARALTGIGLSSIKNATYSGALIARKLGKNTIILPEDLKAWLQTLPLIDKNADSNRA